MSHTTTGSLAWSPSAAPAAISDPARYFRTLLSTLSVRRLPQGRRGQLAHIFGFWPMQPEGAGGCVGTS